MTPRMISAAKVANATMIAGIAKGEPAGIAHTAPPPIIATSRIAQTGITAAAKPQAPMAVTDSNNSSACVSTPAFGSRCVNIAVQPAPNATTSAVTVQNSTGLTSDASPRWRMCKKRSVHSSASPAITSPQPIRNAGSATPSSVISKAATLIAISAVLNGT